MDPETAGWVRTSGAHWSRASFALDRGALVIHRPEHPQRVVRLELPSVRRVDEVVGSARDDETQVELTTTTGATIEARWPPSFGEQVLDSLRAARGRPPLPLPVPATHVLMRDHFGGVRTVGAPDLREASLAALPGRHAANGRRSRRIRHPLRWGATALAVVAGVLFGDLVALHARVERVAVDLPAADDGVRTWLLVGSDSRAAAAGMPNREAFGTVADVRGERADVIMLVQEGRDGRPPTLLSVPRDLLVFRREVGIDRLGLSLLDGEGGLVLSVCRSLGVAVDHVVKVRFDGIRELVDAVGGVEVHVDHPTRDLHTGVDLAPGSNQLDGAETVAWMRARHLERLVDERWQTDPASDTGRQQHQREVLDQLTARMASRARNPIAAHRLAWTTTGAVTTDGATGPVDLVRLALTLRRVADHESLPHHLVDGRIPVATLTPDAQDVLDELRNGLPDGPPCPRPHLGA